MDDINNDFVRRRAYLKNYKSELLSCVYLNELRKMDEEDSLEEDYIQYVNFSILFSEFLLALKNYFAENRQVVANGPFRLHGEESYENPFFRCVLTEVENWVVVEFQDGNFVELLGPFLDTLYDIDFPILKEWVTVFSPYFGIYENKLRIKKYYGIRVVNRFYKSVRNTNELCCLFRQNVNVLTNFQKKLQKFKLPFVEDYKVKRCVAVSVLNKGPNEKKFFSLSGFWDISEIRRYPILHGHQKIIGDCREYDFEKLFNNSSLRGKYTWCKIKGNMKSYMYNIGQVTELKKLKKIGVLGDVKEHYSCCERKILSYIELGNITNIRSLSIQIKLKPCLDCEQAIKGFETHWSKKITISYFK